MFRNRKQAVDYAESLNDRKLVELLNKADKAYYNSDTTIMDDTYYDLIREEASTRTSPLVKEYLKKVGHAPPKRVEVKLPCPMPSQDKIKPGDGSVDKFKKPAPKQWVLMDKLDGVSLLIAYVANKLPKIYTRGETTTGQDVTRLLPHLKIPKKLSESMNVRAEILVSRSSFESMFSKESGGDYENARNMVIGVVGRLKDNSTAKHFDVVCYEIKGQKLTPSQQLKRLDSLGFEVPEYKIVSEIDDSTLTQYLAKRRKNSTYDIDGLIVAKDILYNDSEKNPSHSKAFKVNTSQETEVVDIEWRASRHGKIVPRIHVSPLRIGGVTIKHVTGHNAYFIVHGHRYRDKKEFAGKPAKPIGIGSKVLLSRSGDVIPHITEVLTAKPPKMPDTPYSWDENRVEIYVSNNESRDVIKLKRIAHFFSVLGVDDLGESRVKQLIDSGCPNAVSILNITVADLMKLPGFQETLARKLVSNIKKAREEASLSKWAAASGIFGQGMGERRAEMVFSVYPDVYRDPIEKARKLILQLPNFSDTTTNQFVEGLETFAKFLKAIKYTGTVSEKPKGTKLSGKSFVFTGFRNSEWEKAITQNGGSIASSVNKTTTALVAKDLSSSSSKFTKAKQLGVPILTKDQFFAKYLSSL